MKRTSLDYLHDALESMQKAQNFVEGMEYTAFTNDERTTFATVRAIEIVGEAIKQVPDNVRARFPEIPWRLMAGMRDVLVHAYFGVDLEVVWMTATVNIPQVVGPLTRAIEVLEAEYAAGQT